MIRTFTFAVLASLTTLVNGQSIDDAGHLLDPITAVGVKSRGGQVYEKLSQYGDHLYRWNEKLHCFPTEDSVVMYADTNYRTCFRPFAQNDSTKHTGCLIISWNSTKQNFPVYYARLAWTDVVSSSGEPLTTGAVLASQIDSDEDEPIVYERAVALRVSLHALTVLEKILGIESVAR